MIYTTKATDVLTNRLVARLRERRAELGRAAVVTIADIDWRFSDGAPIKIIEINAPFRCSVSGQYYHGERAKLEFQDIVIRWSKWAPTEGRKTAVIDKTLDRFFKKLEPWTQHPVSLIFDPDALVYHNSTRHCYLGLYTFYVRCRVAAGRPALPSEVYDPAKAA